MNPLHDVLSRLPNGYFRHIEETGLLGQAGEAAVAVMEEAVHVQLHYDLPACGTQDDYFVRFDVGFKADFFWSPHLTPEKGHIVEQHVFRTPALIARGEGKTAILIPCVESMTGSPVRWYLDMDAPAHSLWIGMSESVVDGHVLYRKTEGATYPAGRLTFGFWLLLFPQALENPFRPALDFFWRRYGRKALAAGPEKDLSRYVAHTYRWAFDHWKASVWQEFEMDGRTVGAPVFIVTTSQSPGFTDVAQEREVRSVWNQAWFCSLRSASGLYRHARRTHNQALLRYATMTKELALSFPQTDGLFDAVIATEMEACLQDGKTYQRSSGWDTRYFGNSNRNPFSRDVRSAPRHILDMSVTAYHMLLWYDELEQDERLLHYVRKYAQTLLSLQDDRGFYPAWVDERGKGMGVLDDSPESAMSAVFLFCCHKVLGDASYRDSALRASEAIWRHIVPSGRWEDFETYWSCSSWWNDHVGQKIPRNDLYKSCNLSMFYTAWAFWHAHRETGDRCWLERGRRVLDEMLMTQASYQPAFMAIPVLGGFGVMNADAEWNDARQSLFAELILQYGLELEVPEYVERGQAALRASFAMMYCPENPDVKRQWEIAHPFFSELDYGFNMENYGHDCRTDDQGAGIGEFTIYDWGNGAAAEAYERILDHGLGALRFR